MKYIIRKASKNDFESLNKFGDQESSFVYNALPEYLFCRSDLNWKEKEFSKILREKNSFICVAEFNKKVLGVLYTTKKVDDDYLCGDKEYAELHTFWVDNSETDSKNEIAGSLLHEAEKWTKAQNIKEIRSLEFVQANANKKYYKQAKFDTRNVGLFKDLHS